VKFAVDSVSTDSVRLSWQLNGNQTCGFLVELSADGKSFAEAARLEAGATSCLLTGLAADKTAYTVRLCACAADGLKSDYVSAKFGTAAAQEPSTPDTPGGSDSTDVLFYTDFHTAPQAWADKYGTVTTNTNIVNASNTSVNVGGLIIGSGENSLRILNMPGCQSDDLGSDYGPYTADDAGATPYCIQFYTDKAGGYVQMPQVKGPCLVTIFAGNTSASQRTIKLIAATADSETSKGLVLAAAKRMFKFTYAFADSTDVTFKLDLNAKKVNINDIRIERLTSDPGATGLSAVPAFAVRAFGSQGELTVTGLQAGQQLTIADLTGRIVCNTRIAAPTTLVKRLAPGFYVVVIDGRAVKVRL
jgi:hypothetical protein